MNLAGGIVDLLLRSSLLLAIVWLAAAGVRRAGGSAAMRHMIWLLGLGALLLLPLLTAVLPPLDLPILPATETVSPIETVASAPTAPAPAAPSATAQETVSLGELFELLYLTVAAGLLGRLALGHSLLARLWRRARPAEDAHWQALVDGLRSALDIRRPVALRLATEPAMPMTWGTLSPRILLPAEAAGWTDERRRIVLLHELAHVARRDSFARSAATILCALYWLHPAVWYAARRMRLEQEHACDDLVLSLGAKASVYARNLLDVAGAFQPRPVVASLSVAMARTSELERRLKAIVRRGPRGRSSARFVTSTGAGALGATLLVATMVPVAALQPTPARSAEAPRAAAPPTPALAASAPSATSRPRAPRPAAGPAPAGPIAGAPAPSEDYDAMLARYNGELAAYQRQLEDYDRAVDAHDRQVAALRARGNLANSGNTGNSGNSGNSGNPGIPASAGRPAIPPTPPVPPTPPTFPTPPSPLTAVAALPALPRPPT
ncbi:MAG TPA: M56 family metallopeptidase [Allosphingosinicella sp.]|nr:M56 family metallopeptidase [Allosphingosinicella sp.]